MIVTIANILNPEQISSLNETLKSLDWEDGRKTAGKSARQVKVNEQANLKKPEGASVKSLIAKAIEGHVVVQAAARPNRMSNILISRTTNGGFYGPHVDNAMMKKDGSRLRTDISFTLFLSDPSAYDGGELVLHGQSSAESFKLEPGEMVIYPSSAIHEVTPVKSGERIVCVGWIESLVADVRHREILFDLENLRINLRQSLPSASPEILTIDKSIANLLRLWAKP